MSTADERVDPVRELNRRVEQLEAERDIRAVLHAYCVAIDDGDGSAWADVFTADGVWEVGGPRARMHVRIEGAKALRDFASEHSHPPSAWHKHCSVGSTITVDGEHATAVSYTFRLDGFDDGPAVQSFGRYVDQLTRGADSRWRIAHRELQVESSRDSPFGHQPASAGGERRDVTTTEDEAAIERLMSVYNVATDHRDWRRLADCFTADGVFHGAYGSWNMREQWEAFGARSERRTAEAGPTRHFVTNILTNVHGDTATSSSFVLVTRTMPDNSTIVSMTGEYQDELVKQDGEWRFRTRSVIVDAVGEQDPRPDYRTEPPS